MQGGHGGGRPSWVVVGSWMAIFLGVLPTLIGDTISDGPEQGDQGAQTLPFYAKCRSAIWGMKWPCFCPLCALRISLGDIQNAPTRRVLALLRVL